MKLSIPDFNDLVTSKDPLKQLSECGLALQLCCLNIENESIHKRSSLKSIGNILRLAEQSYELLLDMKKAEQE